MFIIFTVNDGKKEEKASPINPKLFLSIFKCSDSECHKMDNFNQKDYIKSLKF